jgi:hypothetical protein
MTSFQLAISVPKTKRNHRGPHQISMEGGVPHPYFSAEKVMMFPVVIEQTRHKLHVEVFPQNCLASAT